MRKRTLLAGLIALMLGPWAWSLELNIATRSDLIAIGVSPELAERVVSYRETHGDFLSSGDVLKVEGMTQGQLNQLRSSLTIDGQRVTTPSGTAPAIPGVSPAVPAHKVTLVSARHHTTRGLHRHSGRVGRHHVLADDESAEHGRGHGRGGGHGHGGGDGHGGGHGKD
ncbi:Helix-hairpin-helix motif-containing protein [Pseudogulbenkiania subflava DSM 22618]|uniref:Helix-hairpin-helix motif-containing protein n=1 Tax=Pseudogulbenkiania subflava DSM 22618 TaxID=1123014 RepID=A0A1Y6BQ31_9NEIS|nr:Helix-hairpin-helix motif-containing protein [Pseudogulbenkiania subflava DSM 22618]